MELDFNIPEGAIENGAIGIAQYVDEDGEMKYCVSHQGDLPLSSFVGLIEIGKLHLIEQAKEEW